jgi:hypothetical protein
MIPANQLSRDSIQAMNEAQLREDVLIPLFKAAGFKGVHHYHGGAGEQGKDIIMWQEDALGAQEHIGVVVLSKPITGKVEGARSTASKVHFQVRQCLNSKFRNLLKLTEHGIDKCWVVTSQTVKKEARESLANSLGSDIRSVRIIDGDELWSLVERHLKGNLIAAKIDELHETLRSADEGFEIVASVGGANREIQVRSRDGTPFKFVPKFSFPDTKAGREAQRAYEEYVKTGKPVLIPGEFIASVDIAEPLAPLLSIFPMGALVVGPNTTGAVIVCDAICEGVESTHTLSGVYLHVDHFGTESITISNSAQDVPWKVKIILSISEQTAHATMTFHMPSANVKQQLQMAEFQKVLSSDCQLSFVNSSDGMVLLRSGHQGSRSAPVREELLLLLRRLYVIQQRTGLLFSLPRTLTEQGLENVLTVAEIVETGEYRIAGGGILSIPATRKLAQNLVNLGPDPTRHMYLRGEENRVWSVLGVDVPVGKSVAHFWGGRVLPEDAVRIRAELRNKKRTRGFTLRYEIPEKSEIVFTYEKFLPPDHPNQSLMLALARQNPV